MQEISRAKGKIVDIFRIAVIGGAIAYKRALRFALEDGMCGRCILFGDNATRAYVPLTSEKLSKDIYFLPEGAEVMFEYMLDSNEQFPVVQKITLLQPTV